MDRFGCRLVFVFVVVQRVLDELAEDCRFLGKLEGLIVAADQCDSSLSCHVAAGFATMGEGHGRLGSRSTLLGLRMSHVSLATY